MVSFVNFVTLALALVSSATAFPAYGSLTGLSRDTLDTIMPTLNYRSPPGPPSPITFNGTKLVNDAEHPYQPPGPTDQRGPCPGLNTLANHGYLPRNGVATPGQMVTAVQEGFNMAWIEAVTVVYAAHLLDGNLVTDLLSIGAKSPLTGPAPPAPASAAGLDAHGLFEGDASVTRGDAYFGNNFSFNETLFQELVEYSNMYGGGKYNYTVAAELRYKRVQDSIATNPEFAFVLPRYRTAYAEVTFPVNFFIDGRQGDGQLDLDVARTFFETNRMPDDFHRASKPMSKDGIEIILAAHTIQPGRNTNGINTYTPDSSIPTFADDPTGCKFYEYFVNKIIVPLYPNPTGPLKDAVKKNLDYFYLSTNGSCTQVFPYGKDNQTSGSAVRASIWLRVRRN